MKTTIGIIGVAQDLGASRRGVDMGPTALRIAGIHRQISNLGYNIKDYGNITTRDIDQHNNRDFPENPKLRHLESIIESCQKLKETVAMAIDDGCMPLVLGGDHSLTIGTLAGMRKLHNGKTGIIYIDAHGDFNIPETSPSGNIHGMPFAVITGRGDKRLLDIGPSPTVFEQNAVQIGARDIDHPGEAGLLNDSKVRVFTMRDIDRMGMKHIAEEAIDIATYNVDYLHISFDIDAVDPSIAPGTGTPVIGGLTFREAYVLMEYIHDCGKLASFELVEVNPTLDTFNKTAETAVKYIVTALGKNILKESVF